MTKQEIMENLKKVKDVDTKVKANDTCLYVNGKFCLVNDSIVCIYDYEQWCIIQMKDGSWVSLNY